MYSISRRMMISNRTIFVHPDRVPMVS